MYGMVKFKKNLIRYIQDTFTIEKRKRGIVHRSAFLFISSFSKTLERERESTEYHTIAAPV
jgi:hypothetical protein